MSFFKKVAFSILTLGLICSSVVMTNASANYIPLEANMSPQHHNSLGKTKTITKKLSWYDSVTTTYRLTYRDGHGLYHYYNFAITGYSVNTQPTTYTLATGRTTQTFYDTVTVIGSRNTDSMNGSITVH